MALNTGCWIANGLATLPLLLLLLICRIGSTVVDGSFVPNGKHHNHLLYHATTFADNSAGRRLDSCVRSSRRRNMNRVQLTSVRSKNYDDQIGDGDESTASAAQEQGVVLDPKILQRNKCWVILVDDEESIRLSVGDFLFDEGFEVTLCNGAEALLEVLQGPSNHQNGSDQRYFRQEKSLPDVIVSDVRMPEMDGIELLGLLRADPRYQRIPVVLLTAKAMTMDRIAGYKAGADAYLPKPFHPEELLSILDNTIARRQQMMKQNPRSSLVTLKEEMATIKNIMQQNSANTVKQTNVYLTPTERDVLELVCQGYTNKEIAQERGVSIEHIIKIVQKLFRETETKKRTELVRWAFQTGYASPRH